MKRRARLRGYLLQLQAGLVLLALAQLAVAWYHGQTHDALAHLMSMRLARSTCQTLYYAVQEAEKVEWDNAGPTCTMTLVDGREIRWRWQNTWWVREKRL